MAQENLLEVTGEVKSITFRNEDNGFTVLHLCGDEEITAVGIMPMAGVGELVKLIGFFQSHPTYGQQFSVLTYERSLPSDVTGILNYLSSGVVKGIGQSTAKKLVTEFGEQTLDILANEPHRVAEIKGFSTNKAKSISEQLCQLTGMRDVIVYLGKYGVVPRDAISIFKSYGVNAIKIIEENPYVLCSPDFNIPFAAADLIAQKLSVSIDSRFRMHAGLMYVLLHNRNNGHTYLPKKRLIETTGSFLNEEDECCEKVLDEMIEKNEVVEEKVNDIPAIFSADLFNKEMFISSRIRLLLDFPAPQIENIKEEVCKIERYQKITYGTLQKEAIYQALSKGLLILTGGPGTGKTTTINAIIKILRNNGYKVKLAAPTGRAAQRLSSVTNAKTQTLHRLLEVDWTDENRLSFKRNEHNMLQCDALIIDEMSMVDVSLFESVIRALPFGCKLILVGDTNQLPSVGAGNVLADLINAGIIPVVALTEIFRQSLESLIVENAHKIVNGEMPILNRRDKDFFFLPVHNIDMIIRTVIDLCTVRLTKTYGYSLMADIQVLSPGRKGGLGANELNRRLQPVVNPKEEMKPEIRLPNMTLRLGDKVMQVRNNYNIIWTAENGTTGEGVFNGDIGKLTEINDNIFKVTFDDKIAEYNMESALDLDLCYATTVHKSQGNEFTAVIIPVYKGAPQLNYRNLLYTAVTRAKKLLILVGDVQTIEQMVNNNKRTKRYSGLCDFLKREYDNSPNIMPRWNQ